MNGNPLNTALIARQIGVSRPTALSRVLALQRHGLLRLLPHFGGHSRPLIFLRNSYGVDSSSFRALCVEAVGTTLQLIDAEAQFFWWKTGRVRRIDLLATMQELRIGFCFSAPPLYRRKDWKPLLIGYDRGLIHRGFLLHGGSRAFGLGTALQALPLRKFLEEPREWIFDRLTSRRASEAMRLINESAAALRLRAKA